MNFRHASNSRALVSPTRVMASGSWSSILRSIWSSSFSQSLIARNARREPSARKSLTLKTASRAIKHPRTTWAESSSSAKSSLLLLLRGGDGRGRASAARDRVEVERRLTREAGGDCFRGMENSRSSGRTADCKEASINREYEGSVNGGGVVSEVCISDTTGDCPSSELIR